jgi:hypothetical protein
MCGLKTSELPGVFGKSVYFSQGMQPSTYMSALRDSVEIRDWTVMFSSGIGVRGDDQGLALARAERAPPGPATGIASSLVILSLLPILLDS